MKTEMLEARINRWKFVIAGFAVFLISAYFWYFGFRLEQPAAENADKWGQFGDYIGGLLNPMVAFAAFYWLTQSIKIQNHELSQTTHALQEQAKNSDLQVAIASRTALVTALQNQIDGYGLEVKRCDDELEGLYKEIKSHQESAKGRGFFSDDLRNEAANEIELRKKRIKDIQQEVAGYGDLKVELSFERDKLLNELRGIVSSSRFSDVKPG